MNPFFNLAYPGKFVIDVMNILSCMAKDKNLRLSSKENCLHYQWVQEFSVESRCHSLEVASLTEYSEGFFREGCVVLNVQLKK